ncbi:SDR family oxidoreductase [Paraburkholderia hospita]|uniref:SDR family NAD(P)-dependent oxidoreductase n=1 Tax=Paraburkholderia hospita TaxID=169430 RepID=A0AAN1MMF2_9BURK|nr:SDR family oxidoreductase [Paraburkholderia hospita]AUT72488.1 SDR family NAD(P)-dependent oxidoreductase [Paraburkholderia hospita]EIN00836.1 putative short-chain dehydrogenase [Paraburkholderia hospita]OUL75999.1 short-chain dehydrogenase [Paraburkholderia hospita]OUL76824.1 short-chain dehydrogenase [Paraburkholderia hospita]SEI00349.1 NADP-dependent 3-hydroxy acid dehydrogenase YdfG [Paraburkholderia hospita]
MTSHSYQTALVTGASSGIGRAIAQRLVTDGLKVYALGRDAKALDALASECDVTPIALDLQDTTPLRDLFARTEIDVVVNNAGLLPALAKFAESELSDIDRMIDINLRAPLRLAHMALDGMIQRRRGHLFFVGSSAGRFPHPNTAVYGATKAGISMFCDSLRCDLLGTKVRVTEIAPGRVQTSLYRTALGAEGANEKLYDAYRSIQPENIAELIATAIALPEAVDVSRMEVFPTDQAAGGSQIVSVK